MSLFIRWDPGGNDDILDLKSTCCVLDCGVLTRKEGCEHTWGRVKALRLGVSWSGLLCSSLDTDDG